MHTSCHALTSLKVESDGQGRDVVVESREEVPGIYLIRDGALIQCTRGHPGCFLRRLFRGAHEKIGKRKSFTKIRPQ